MQVHILKEHAVRALHKNYFKLSKYNSVYFHFLNSGLNPKPKHFQINAFLSQRIIVFSWFHFYSFQFISELPNIIINKDHKLYIFSCLLYFSPFSLLKVKCLELPLSFIYSNKTEKFATFTRLREATEEQSTTPD